MRIGFGQIIVVSLILLLLFGDIQNLKKKIVSLFNKLRNLLNQK